MPAATSAFSGKGLLGLRPAPIYEINPTAQGAGYLSKELINKMIVGFKRIGRTLTDLYVSPEDAADIREWTDQNGRTVWKRAVEKLVNSVNLLLLWINKRTIPSQVCL